MGQEQEFRRSKELEVLDPRRLAKLLPLSANEKRGSRPIRGQYAGHPITPDQSLARSQLSPSFSFLSPSSFRIQEVTPRQPPPYSPFTSPSTSASYPIVTLPRSQRKDRSSLLTSLFKPSSDLNTSSQLLNTSSQHLNTSSQHLNTSINSSLPWKTSLSSSSSSCSCSSFSSCSSCYRMEGVNHVRLAQYPFIRDSVKMNTKRSLRHNDSNRDEILTLMKEFIFFYLFLALFAMSFK